MNGNGNVFSNWFEDKLLDLIEKVFQRLLTIVEQRNQKPGFIRRENACKYYDGISETTLIKYEKLGLKTYEPIENGYIYYSTDELDKFMGKYEK